MMVEPVEVQDFLLAPHAGRYVLHDERLRGPVLVVVGHPPPGGSDVGSVGRRHHGLGADDGSRHPPGGGPDLALHRGRPDVRLGHPRPRAPLLLDRDPRVLVLDRRLLLRAGADPPGSHGSARGVRLRRAQDEELEPPRAGLGHRPRLRQLLWRRGLGVHAHPAADQPLHPRHSVDELARAPGLLRRLRHHQHRDVLRRRAVAPLVRPGDAVAEVGWPVRFWLW